MEAWQNLLHWPLSATTVETMSTARPRALVAKRIPRAFTVSVEGSGECQCGLPTFASGNEPKGNTAFDRQRAASQSGSASSVIQVERKASTVKRPNYRITKLNQQHRRPQPPAMPSPTVGIKLRP